MKKYLLSVIIFFLLFNIVFSQNWIEGRLISQNVDESGLMYYQTCEGKYDNNFCSCLMSFGTFDTAKYCYQGLYFIFVINNNPFIPSFSSEDSNVSLKITKDEIVEQFEAELQPIDDINTIKVICKNKTAFNIYKLIKDAGTWDISCTGKEWTCASKINGNKLPLSLDENNILLTTNDKKTVMGIKPWARKIIESIEIPDGVKEIADDAFNYCTSLKSVKTPTVIIGRCAFANCIALEKIEISGLGEQNPFLIKYHAFYNCRLLGFPVFLKNSKFTVPNDEESEIISSIEGEAFAGCYSFTNKDLKNTGLYIKNDFLFCKEIPISLLNLDADKYILSEKDDEHYFKYILSFCPNVKDIVFSKKTKMVIIDYKEYEGSFPSITKINSITCPKSVKIKNLPTSIQIIRNK